jgi:hypothetical protein
MTAITAQKKEATEAASRAPSLQGESSVSREAA